MTSRPKKRDGSPSPTVGTVGSDTEEATGAREVLDGLRRIVRELRRSSRESERSLGVSAAQLLVLQVLAEKPACSVNDLAALTNTDQSSVSVVVRRLAEAELVARKMSIDDGRRVELRLTPAGRRLIAKRPPPAQVRLFAALERLNAAELNALHSGLAAVVREMDIADSPPTMFFEEDESPLASAPRPKTRSFKRDQTRAPAPPSRAREPR